MDLVKKKCWADIDTQLGVRHHNTYTVDIHITDLSRFMRNGAFRYGMDMAPSFRRGPVWSRAQQEAYITSFLRGMPTAQSNLIQWNSPAFGGKKHLIVGLHKTALVIVDGLQRITALEAFVRGDITLANWISYEYLVDNDYLCAYHQFHFVVLPFATYAEVLAYYLAINASGTPHSEHEIQQVRDLLAAQPNTGPSV